MAANDSRGEDARLGDAESPDDDREGTPSLCAGGRGWAVAAAADLVVGDSGEADYEGQRRMVDCERRRLAWEQGLTWLALVESVESERSGSVRQRTKGRGERDEDLKVRRER